MHNFVFSTQLWIIFFLYFSAWMSRLLSTENCITVSKLSYLYVSYLVIVLQIRFLSNLWKKILIILSYQLLWHNLRSFTWKYRQQKILKTFITNSNRRKSPWISRNNNFQFEFISFSGNGANWHDIEFLHSQSCSTIWN